jgi:chemotaxis protein CheD
MPGIVRLHVAEGETQVSVDPELCLTTVLGSCVAACFFDPAAGAGGMCHFLLPGGEGTRQAGAAERYGAYLMEVLVNGLMSRGARRERLRAKLFGGAATLGGRGETGRRNGEFAKQFLQTERIPLMATSLGGTVGRRVEFWPVSGRARQLYLDAPVSPPPAPVPVADVGAIEFF